VQQCGGVGVTFPKEKGSSKVTVRGAREDVDKAKQALLDLANEKALNSFSLEVPIKKQFHRFIIGPKGSYVNKIKDATGVRLIFPAAQDEDADTVTIIGKEASCAEARDKILARVKELESIVEETVDVPAAYHRNFFQRQGALLKEITDEFGVIVNFPRTGDTITVRGGVELVAQAIARINQLIEYWKNEISKTVTIASEHHGFIVGTGGKNVQKIIADRTVNIRFPKRAPKGGDAKPATEAAAATPAADAAAEATDAESANVDAVASSTSVDADAEGDAGQATSNPADTITIKGLADNVELAIKDLLALVPETEQFPLANDFHGSIIGPKGESVKKLMTDFDVNIKIPSQGQHADHIVLKGLRSNLDAVKEALTKRIVELEADKADRSLRSFKLQVRVPSSLHAGIIGKAGAGVQKLRAELDVQFEFPKRSQDGKEAADSDLITIIGYEAKVNAARDVLLSKVGDLEKIVTKSIEVDPRVHSRIIGGRGAGIKTLQEKYKVRVNFPKDKNSSTISVVGEFDDVDAAVNEIQNKAEEYLEDALERAAPTYNSAPAKAESSAQSGEFKVRDAPWSANDQSQFPTLGSPTKKASAPTGAWGRK